MFTGRIAEVGVIDSIDEDLVGVRSPRAAAGAQPGGSVCVNGVRLTVRALSDGVAVATVAAETKRRSTFDVLAAGEPVNVELPLAVGDRLDGHLVQGYVDAVGKVVRVEDEGGGCSRVWIRPPERSMSQLFAKAPLAVDGVSLTVAERLRDRFSVVVLPATRAATTLERLEPGVRVNLEVDLISRLTTRNPDRARGFIDRIVTGLPWAGHVAGKPGVEKVVRQLAAGGGVVVWDPATEGEGDVIFAGAQLPPQAFTFLLTEACGHTTVPCAPEVLERLEIGPIPGEGDRQGTAMHVPVDLAATSTGVSAAERAATVRRLADPDARPDDFLRPGHVFPLRARPGLLAERQGHTEATVALCLAAGLPPVGVCCEVMNPDGLMAQAADLEAAALRWGMPLVDICDLRAWL
ncbi:3,4-dihydroxy-2-butanone-4-phosphate synthase [Streptomyces sp. RB6PN25]|uniref:3,4-dihydroxy-2-butanone-4-phosphate synthase n=1 Tax=Streptomyces humicola TaxID=2953240 RepID=A0ABT1PX65_9ACTN|nr:3,4-dihydroxy-2-butanone-4-phosphate synthase [Streptomyces humicola]MCQ4082276.1 3,4-dihydroxy-2-butanone-4-phosphate synthase [Streptomyces humicola]